MGTWGIQNFENDGALDFVHILMEDGKEEILKAIQNITNLEQGDYLEAPECGEALAAIELIAAAQGKQSSDCDEEILNWIKENDLSTYMSELIEKKIVLSELASSAIDRIIENSELKELWEETAEFEEWKRVQTELKERIR